MCCLVPCTGSFTLAHSQAPARYSKGRDSLKAWVRRWSDSTISQAARSFQDVVAAVTASSPRLNILAALQTDTTTCSSTAEQSAIAARPSCVGDAQLRVQQPCLPTPEEVGLWPPSTTCHALSIRAWPYACTWHMHGPASGDHMQTRSSCRGSEVHDAWVCPQAPDTTAESHAHRAANQPSCLELLGTGGERVSWCREDDGVACQGLGGVSIGEGVGWVARYCDAGAGCKGVTGQADRHSRTLRSTCQRLCPRDCIPRWRLGDVHPHKKSHRVVAALQLPAKLHPGGRAIHGHALVAAGVAVAGRHLQLWTRLQLSRVKVVETRIRHDIGATHTRLGTGCRRDAVTRVARWQLARAGLLRRGALPCIGGCCGPCTQCSDVASCLWAV